MSEPGDCVWADGRAWMRTDWDEKSRWITESIARPENRTTLKALKQHDDFRWLVRNGYRQINDYPLAHEAYRFQIANLTELLAQAEKERDAAENRYASALDAQLSRAALEERAAIVDYVSSLRGDEFTVAANDIACGAHLAGDDE